MTPKKYWFKKGTISRNLHCFKTLLQKYFLTVYYERNLHSMMPIFWRDKSVTNTIDPSSHILILCVEEAWGGLGLDPKHPLQPKLLMGVYAFVVIGGWQFCFGPKGILVFFCFFCFLFFFLGPAWVIRLLSEDQWALHGFSSLMKFPLLYFISISSKCYCRGSKF